MQEVKALPDAIRAYLKEHPAPQLKLAKELGVSQSWLSKFTLNRIKEPRLDLLFRLASWVEKDRAANSVGKSN